MNDYKELIDGLQRLEFFNQRAGRELWADKPHDVQERDIESAQNILLSTIGTIEQLVKERDYAMDIANNTHYSAMIKLQKNDETIAGLFRDRDILHRKRDELATKCSQLEKERDAAVAALKEYCDCDVCKNNNDG